MQRHLARILFREVPKPHKFNPNGAVLWEGPSELTGRPIAVVVTGLASASANGKTGGALQVWYIPQDVSPIDAWRAGTDSDVCGDCIHGSPHRAENPGLGSCYVEIGKAPGAVSSCYRRGGYRRWDPLTFARYAAAHGPTVRFGAWGDPASVPASVARMLAAGVRDSDRLGYTHQWQTAHHLRGIVQASVDSEAERATAEAFGWATFRVAEGADDRARGEARCPASAEAGHRVKCDGCPIKCNGTTRGGITGVVIIAHGATANRFEAAA
jgi:hypothetical protein